MPRKIAREDLRPVLSPEEHRALFLRRVKWFEAWATAYINGDEEARRRAAHFLLAALAENYGPGWHHLAIEMKLLHASEDMHHQLAEDTDYKYWPGESKEDRKRIAEKWWRDEHKFVRAERGA